MQKQSVIATLLLAVAAVIFGGAVVYVVTRTESLETITMKWDASGHADRSAESFVHWNEDDPPVIPASCAHCHSSGGYLDYVGEDGTEALSVDAENHSIGTVVSCTTCHNIPAMELQEVPFPSGETLTASGSEGGCWVCHQGRASGLDVDNASDELDLDEVSEDLSFINVHYAIAAATQAGSDAAGGYQYEGEAYAGFFEHTANYETCTDCHDPHSLSIDPKACSTCHLNIVDYEDVRDIKQEKVDYDGDGDADEGVLAEIEALQDTLYEAMQLYSAEVVESPIIYANSFPYFFADTNGNGEPDDDEVAFPNSYKSWTPRLLRAAYNYQFVKKDHGAYVHNADYVLQLLYDSIADLGEQVEIEMEGMIRPDAPQVSASLSAR